MLKKIFFTVWALLWPGKSNIDCLNVESSQSDAAYHLLLLVALTKSEIRLHFIKRKCLARALMLLFFLLGSFKVQSQSTAPLSIGDKVPAVVLNASFPVFGSRYNAGDSIKLGNYKGKIILIDFWATWCTNCIYKFPLLEQLQQKYRDDLVVVLVDTRNTKDTPQRIAGILSGEKAPFQKSDLFTIYGDTLLMKIFPHRYLPHYVWIGKDGTLKLLSSAEMLNAATITALLPNQHLTTQKK